MVVTLVVVGKICVESVGLGRGVARARSRTARRGRLARFLVTLVNFFSELVDSLVFGATSGARASVAVLVPAAALQMEGRCSNESLQFGLVTRWTVGERFFSNTLRGFERVAAALTLVVVSWHGGTLPNGAGYAKYGLRNVKHSSMKSANEIPEVLDFQGLCQELDAPKVSPLAQFVRPQVVAIPFGSAPTKVVTANGFIANAFVDDVHAIVRGVDEPQALIEVGNCPNESLARWSDDGTINPNDDTGESTVPSKLGSQRLPAGVDASAHRVLNNDRVGDGPGRGAAHLTTHRTAVDALFAVVQDGVVRKKATDRRSDGNAVAAGTLTVAVDHIVDDAVLTRRGTNAKAQAAVTEEDRLLDDQAVTAERIDADAAVLYDAAQDPQATVFATHDPDGIPSNYDIAKNKRRLTATDAKRRDLHRAADVSARPDDGDSPTIADREAAVQTTGAWADDDEICFGDGARDLAKWSLAASRRRWSSSWTAIGIDKDDLARRYTLTDFDLGQIDHTTAEVAHLRINTLAVSLAGSTRKTDCITNRLAAIGAVRIKATLPTVAFAGPGSNTGGHIFLVPVLTGLVGNLGRGQDIAGYADCAVTDGTLADSTLLRGQARRTSLATALPGLGIAFTTRSTDFGTLHTVDKHRWSATAERPKQHHNQRQYGKPQ